MSAVRHLIYLGNAVPASLQAALATCHWTTECLTPALLRKGLRHQRGVAVAVVDFSAFGGQQDLRPLETFLAGSGVSWIAVVAAGQMDRRDVRSLVRDHCFDFLTLPVADQRLVAAIGHVHGMASLGDVVDTVLPTAPNQDGIIGNCDSMLALFRSIRKVAMTDAPVFISGESGTGKELTAQAIHARSPRRKAPFVPINCGAIPPHLLQSELFGYEKGAFTGAAQRKIGRVEAASGGTLFLDEIGDLPIESQASLLRFLQEGTIERLGGHESIAVDVRIVSATHVHMARAMGEGRFRDDLFHRLCVLQISEPPLRARGKDIELLATHALMKFRKDAGRRLTGFSTDAVAAMNNYTWPGNVRELINRVRRAIVMSEGRSITASDLDLAEHVALVPISLAQARDVAERQAIEIALLRHRGRVGAAAQELGISRVTLYRLLQAQGLRNPADEGDRDIIAAA